MSIEADRDTCAQIAERQGPNFSIGFRTLPDRKRWAIQSSYAFCRIADDLSDEAPGAAIERRQQALRAWREELDRVYRGDPTHVVGRALAASLEDFDIPRQSFADLIEGCEEDLDFRQPHDQADLDHYCDLVATSMGRICLSIFGNPHHKAESWARSLSHALQLTNILRDVREDFERGRIYLPREWMEQEHVMAEELVPSTPTAAWNALMSRGIVLARRNFEASLPLVATVEADSGLAVALMRGVYLEILEEIERDPARVLRERVTLGPASLETVGARARAVVSRGEAVLTEALGSDTDLQPTETPTAT